MNFVIILEITLLGVNFVYGEIIYHVGNKVKKFPYVKFDGTSGRGYLSCRTRELNFPFIVFAFFG